MLAVVFDMDGILFDTQKIYLKTWLEVGAMLQIPDIEKPAYQCIGRNRHDQHELLQELYQGAFPYDEFYRLKDQVFQGYLERDGVPLMKGTKEILAYLKEVGAKVAIASSSAVSSVEHHIKEHGLEGYFDQIVGGDLVVHSKPSPDIYLKACELLEVEPAATYAVEDSYNGILSAVAAGMKTIMIPDVLPPTEEYDRVIHKRFDTLIDLIEYLKEV